MDNEARRHPISPEAQAATDMRDIRMVSVVTLDPSSILSKIQRVTLHCRKTGGGAWSKDIEDILAWVAEQRALEKRASDGYR